VKQSMSIRGRILSGVGPLRHQSPGPSLSPGRVDLPFIDSLQSLAVQIAAMIATNGILSIRLGAKDDHGLASGVACAVPQQIHRFHATRGDLGEGLSQVLRSELVRNIRKPHLETGWRHESWRSLHRCDGLQDSWRPSIAPVPVPVSVTTPVSVPVAVRASTLLGRTVAWRRCRVAWRIIPRRRTDWSPRPIT